MLRQFTIVSSLLRRKTTIVITSCLLTVATVGTQASLAQSLNSALGPLAAQIHLGSDGVWKAAVEGGQLTLSNTAQAGAVRYYYVPWQGKPQQGRSVGVYVTSTDTGGSAGLIFRLQTAGPDWLAMVLRGNGQILVYHRTPDAFRIVAKKSLAHGTGIPGVLLQLSERAGTSTLLANGELVTRLKTPIQGAENELPVGILAIGPGSFSFNMFKFGASVTAKPVQNSGNDQIPAAGGNDKPPVPSPDNGRKQPADTGPTNPLNDPLTVNTIGAIIGVVAHEVGHFIIGELKIPSTGPEEDVADEFSATVFVDNIKTSPELSSKFATATALFWLYSAIDKGNAQHSTPWYDEHAPDMRRFGKYICILYGAYPQRFQAVIDKAGIPRRRQKMCLEKEPKRRAAWDALLRGHRRRGVDPMLEGTLDPSTPGGKIIVEYRKTNNPANNKLETYFKKTKLFEIIADGISKLYVLPRDTKIIITDCKMANAYYADKDGSITLCYEMAQSILRSFQHHQQNGSESKTITLADFLVGTWQMTTTTPNGTEAVVTKLLQGGSYQTELTIRSNMGQIVFHIEGRWSISPAGGKKFDFTLDPTNWWPRENCNYGSCKPYTMSKATSRLTIVNRNTLRSDRGLITRVP